LLVDDRGTVKLADFGASKHVRTIVTLGAIESINAAVQMVRIDGDETHSIKGTPYFMAPEVLGLGKYGRRAVQNYMLAHTRWS
jgi:serine/threonine protein kinase